MKCGKMRTFLADMAFGSGDVPMNARRHLEECSVCQAEWKELQATMRALDAWEVPEPGPYFDTRMAVRLREERNRNRPGWVERLRARMLFDSNLRLRPAIAAVLAILVIAGAGSYEAIVNLGATAPQQQAVSATVNDLELFDSNAKTIQQLASFDDTDSSAAQLSGGNMSN